LPAVPATSTTAQPLALSKPFEKSVVDPQVAVKFCPVTFAPVMVTERLVGEKVQPLLLGVTV
jgi:hypothetical protein